MPHKKATKRQIAAQETKKKLVAAAFEIFKEQGFYSINVEDITKKAGVAKGTFYTYFKRKEDVVLEISRAPFFEIAKELESMQDTPLTQRLSHYFHRFMECVESAGIHICRQWSRDMLDPKNVSSDKDAQKWAYDVAMLEGIFTQAITKGELKQKTPTKLLSYILITQLYGMMTSWCMSDGEFEPLEWTHSFCEFQLETLLKPYIL
ncbi:TetR/AcrR family transcriptional regulator [uncultured Helicobacter sp.]|uniref:TetR/AcrR family transcriptional regulator n=1 Tax=uncultured Helicobacter sp. TaxID=175537 RepID=UPI00374EA202